MVPSPGPGEAEADDDILTFILVLPQSTKTTLWSPPLVTMAFMLRRSFQQREQLVPGGVLLLQNLRSLETSDFWGTGR